MSDFIFLGSKIVLQSLSALTLRHLLLGRKAMTKLDSALKSRDTTLPTKVCLVKAMAFLVVMYGCGLDHKRLSNKESTVLIFVGAGKLLRVPWTARGSNKSIL